MTGSALFGTRPSSANWKVIGMAILVLVMAELIPAIPKCRAQCPPKRGHRDKAPVATSQELLRAFLLLLLPHHLDEAREQVVAVARAGRCFRVVLHREHRFVLQRDAAIRAIEQRDVRLLD